MLFTVVDLTERVLRRLLHELMKGPHGLPDDVNVLVHDRGPDEFIVRYADDDGIPIELNDSTRAGSIYGLVVCIKNWKLGETFEVVSSDAASGYGPLLYDVAMEHATSLKSALMADRSVVSDEALAVWKRYMQRPDVESSEIPDNAHWTIPPLSLRFTKEPATINRLKQLGKLFHSGRNRVTKRF